MIPAWWTTFAAWHCIAVLLLIRRLIGAFSQPLPGSIFILVSLLVVVVSAALRMGALRIRFPVHEVVTRCLLIAPAVAALFILGSITLPNSPLFSAITAWIVVVAAETAWLTDLIRSWRRGEPFLHGSNSDGATLVSTSNLDGPAAHPVQLAIEPGLNLHEESLPAEVTQQLIRSRHEGGEAIAGLVRVEFAAQERTQVVHLAFCPPFKTIPSFDVAPVSGPAVSTKVTQIEQFGVRIEVKHNESNVEACSVVLEIEATAADDVP